jgi:ABC-type transport system substrate-binding protein
MKPFDDIRVRHALAMAIDRDAISEVLVGAVTPAYQFMPPTMLGYQEDLIPEMRYNPDGARALLEEAGFPGGKDFPKFWINSNHTDDYQAMFEAISSMYKDVLGIEMELALMDAGARGAWVDQEPFRLNLWRERWGMDFPDTHNSMNFQRQARIHGNFEKHPEQAWKDDKFEELVIAAGQEAEPAKRHELYKQADRILCWENPIIIPIYYAASNLMKKPRVTNVWVTGMGPNYRNVVIEG